VKPVPIFDTSALINLSHQGHLDAVVRRLKPLIPSHGCPVSFVTAVELFHGLCLGGTGRIVETVKPLLLAAQLSRRKVLRVPLSFAGWELFQAERFRRSRPRLLEGWLATLQMPNFVERFASGEVREMNLEKIEGIFEMIRAGAPHAITQMLDRLHPMWRDERQNGSALPEHMREEVKRSWPFEKWKGALPEQLVREMQIERTSANIERARVHCDAYFTFTINLIRDSTIGNYRFEDRPNDFHDGMQMLYLTRSSHCVVIDDGPSMQRVRQSHQRSRIMSLNDFLGQR
jgi:hypothetical protein